jgi:hypothetical protein
MRRRKKVDVADELWMAGRDYRIVEYVACYAFRGKTSNWIISEKKEKMTIL